MNAQINTILVRINEIAQTYRSMALVLLMVISLSIYQLAGVFAPAAASGPDTTLQLYEMVVSEQGDEALQVVMAEALTLGGWGPAPGDIVVYDSDLASVIGGAVRFIDAGPAECADPVFARRLEECLVDYTLKQNWVRLGRATFVKGAEEDAPAPYPVFDDLLATYIEEVGHSWQEYLFETDGLGTGERLHLTSWDDGRYYQIGWEYQIKRYVLSLDGDLLTLSDEARTRLMSDICDSDGYANPMGHEVPAYGAPSGWPHAENWPASVPTPEEFQAFCALL